MYHKLRIYKPFTYYRHTPLQLEVRYRCMITVHTMALPHNYTYTVGTAGLSARSGKPGYTYIQRLVTLQYYVPIQSKNITHLVNEDQLRSVRKSSVTSLAQLWLPCRSTGTCPWCLVHRPSTVQWPIYSSPRGHLGTVWWNPWGWAQDHTQGFPLGNDLLHHS